MRNVAVVVRLPGIDEVEPGQVEIWREGAKHRWFGPDNAVDVWSVKKVNQRAMVHLTEKPTELAVRAMGYSTKEGEHVLDLFGGSGSTLIAAQQMNRRAFLMEIDPPYCDVIVDRWQGTTGAQARLGAVDGPSWDEVRKERLANQPSPQGSKDAANGQPAGKVSAGAQAGRSWHGRRSRKAKTKKPGASASGAPRGSGGTTTEA